MSVGCDQDVSRFDVSMDQPQLVGIFKSQSGLPDDPRGMVHRQRSAAANQATQIGAGHILGDQVINIPVLAGVKRTHDVGTIQARLHTNLACEGGPRFFGRFFPRQDFDGTLAPHHFVDRFENLPHASLTNPIGDHVRTQVAVWFAPL